MNRKNFLQKASLGVGGAIVAPQLLFSQVKQDKGDPLPAEKVKEFVGAGHNNLDKVKSMLAEFPTLVYANWDWGGGDFETGIEGAGHVGNREIANYLIEKGARTNLFVLTMLGKTQIIKAFLDAYPQYINARGPHGYTLLHHAKRGGEEARELLEYFETRGLKETRLAL